MVPVLGLVQLRWITQLTTAVIFPGDPVATWAEVRFWWWQVREVGSKFGDGGFNRKKIGRGWGKRIVSQYRGAGGIRLWVMAI
jgi:hypothetical protein